MEYEKRRAATWNGCIELCSLQTPDTRSPIKPFHRRSGIIFPQSFFSLLRREWFDGHYFSIPCFFLHAISLIRRGQIAWSLSVAKFWCHLRIESLSFPGFSRFLSALQCFAPSDCRVFGFSFSFPYCSRARYSWSRGESHVRQFLLAIRSAQNAFTRH